MSNCPTRLAEPISSPKQKFRIREDVNQVMVLKANGRDMKSQMNNLYRERKKKSHMNKLYGAFKKYIKNKYTRINEIRPK